MHQQNIMTLRKHLFDTLADLRNNCDAAGIEQARAICGIAKEITDTARVEIDFLRVTGEVAQSGFISPTADRPAITDGIGTDKTATGVRVTERVTGGTVTVHKIR